MHHLPPTFGHIITNNHPLNDGNTATPATSTKATTNQQQQQQQQLQWLQWQWQQSGHFQRTIMSSGALPPKLIGKSLVYFFFS
jgi:transcription initiation factor TFIID subunit TAF12